MKDGSSALATEMATTSTGVNTLQGWFVPRVTGMHTFWAACEDGCTVSIAETPDTRDKLTEIIKLKEGTGRRDYFTNEGQKSQSMNITQGKKYFIQVSNGGEGHMAVAVEID